MLAGLTLLAACGKKGPPLAPLQLAPARIEDLTVTRANEQIRARFTVPSANSDASRPATLSAVELYGLSGKVEDPFGQSLSNDDFLKYGTKAGRIEIQPPPEPTDETPDEEKTNREKAEDAARRALPVDPRPVQGAVVSITETIGPETLKPFVHPKKKQTTVDETKEEVAPGTPLMWPQGEEVFSRVYIAVGISRKGHYGPTSPRITVPLIDPPAAMEAPGVSNTEQGILIWWTMPPGAKRRMLELAPATPTTLKSHLLVPDTAPTSFVVYDAERRPPPAGIAAAQAALAVRAGKTEAERRDPSGEFVITTPVAAAPVEGSGMADTRVQFGVERCYAVTAVQVYGSARLESGPSPVTCITPEDKFPPAAPKGLAAVGSEGGVSLIWEANTEADLAGYVVLRAEAPADGAAAPPLAPLFKAPIRDTNYRDATARPGIRYVYAVVAVDKALPPNTSPESTRVEESAR